MKETGSKKQKIISQITDFFMDETKQVGNEKGKGPDKKLAFILYGMLWFLLILIVSTMAYLESIGEPATIFTAFDELERFHIFYWLLPVTWGKCIKWTIFYWIGIGLFLIYEKKYHHDAAGIEAGSAHWNDDVEGYNKTHNEPFNEAGFSDAIGGWKENLNNPKDQDGNPVDAVPGNPNMIMSSTVRLSTADMKTHMNNNVFIVGGAGTGKSRFFIKPNVLQMNCSYVVTDPSGELLKSMRNVLVDKGGYKIKVFNLVDMSHSCKYNPFKYIRTETDVSIMVDCFISNTTAPDQKSGDPFWDKSEKALLSALVFYLVDIADEEYRKFSTVLWMVQLAQMDENAKSSTNTPLDDLFEGKGKISKKTVKGKEILIVEPTSEKEEKELVEKIEISLCNTNYKTFKLGGTKTLKSILISAAVRLNPFSIPAIQNLTDDDNVELEQVGDELTCFFAIIPQTNSTFNFLISMLFSQMFESLYYKGSTIPNSRLKYHVRFLLDEFANIGKIPEFPQKISTCRKYNISTTIVLQSIAQIKTLYKDDYETIIANCDTSICLGTNEQTTADYFSKKLGKATITSRSKSSQVGKSGGSLSYNQTGRELMTPDEIMTMPYDRCIVMMNHVNPFYDEKYKLEEHPLFQETGDGDRRNLYSLESDNNFLCVDNSGTFMKKTAEKNTEQEGKEEDWTEPEELSEALKKLLLNVPEEDGYYVIRNEEETEQTKSALIKKKEEVLSAIEKCITEGYKTPCFDAEDIDPAFAVPLITRIMNTYPDTQDAILIYDGIASRHSGVVAFRKDGSNAKKVLEKIKLGMEKKSKNEDGVEIYVLHTFAGETLEELKKGCKKGHEIIVVSDDDDDDNFYSNY